MEALAEIKIYYIYFVLIIRIKYFKGYTKFMKKMRRKIIYAINIVAEIEYEMSNPVSHEGSSGNVHIG